MNFNLTIFWGAFLAAFLYLILCFVVAERLSAINSKIEGLEELGEIQGTLKEAIILTQNKPKNVGK